MYYVAPLYWDQWEIVRDILERNVNLFSLKYLFNPHNEHIIATTKIFFIMDYLFFDLTNGPLVALIFILAFILSIFMSFFVVSERKKIFLLIVLVSILFASNVSLAQFENLLWGFQPQFYLVSLTACLSVLTALKMVESEIRSGRLFWFSILCITTFLCIFSMGNGIAIPVSILLFLIFVKWRHWSMITGYLAISVLYICIDLYLTRYAVPVGDLNQRTVPNVLFFFFTMIGGALSRDIDTARTIGLGIFGLYGISFYKLIAMPWWKREAIDKGVAALFALASFFFAAAVAAAWTRSPLGQGASLASRYSTPMLLLIMTLFCVWLRETLVQKVNKNFSSVAILLAMVMVVVASTFREKNAVKFSEEQTRAAYFALSQVDSDEQFLKLYPDAEAVRFALNWLRQNQLNIFSRNGGIDTPNATELLDVQGLDNSRVCENYAIDRATETSSGQLQLVGWIADEQKRTPAWVLAFDGQGNLLGFTKPLEDRPDVTAVVQAETGFRGFVLPVNMRSQEHRPIELRVISTKRETSCKVNNIKLVVDRY